MFTAGVLETTNAMESTDSESSEDEPEHKQQPYVDIDAVNSTLTVVHEQYNKLLLKYSDALNVIDHLKCQLACGINYGSTGALQRKVSVSDLRVHSPETEYAFTHTRRTPVDTRSGLLKLGVGKLFPETAIFCNDDLARLPEPKHASQIALQYPEESTSQAESDDQEACHASEFQGPQTPPSNYASIISDPPEESLVSQVTVVADANKFSEPGANDRVRSGPPSRKKSPGQRKHNQVAVVYPALRNAQICTMACCMTHSCCCCKHMENPKKPTCTLQTPSAQSCFTAHFSAPVAPFSQKCLCSGTDNTTDAALFKISSALDTALQIAGELRNVSFSLVEKW
ncbi:hypothetical protein V5799_009445 [Amblyomma americanum]|uniref:Uncharacterized protein n=1 Tax=Amblyomma americanum TaxID=6943 RepID=A0AAQ4FC78_AMBAM